MRIEIKYPMISFGITELEITDEEFERIEAMDLTEKAKYIKENAEPWDSDWMNEKDIASALDVDYAYIKEIKD